MQDVSVILKLIARGLIDIRTAANSGNAKACFILSDFIHVLPHTAKEGANKRGNSSRLTQSFHFFMFEPIFSPVNALNQPI
ncbi:hypothetical protein [Escherichia coli]|uniref:hypothetical protein n=1 Tax=Escherichia coli TaxID=562 RepID=UPI0039EEF5D0